VLGIVNTEAVERIFESPPVEVTAMLSPEMEKAPVDDGYPPASTQVGNDDPVCVK
jgi:hypothetical protein